MVGKISQKIDSYRGYYNRGLCNELEAISQVHISRHFDDSVTRRQIAHISAK